MDLKPKALIFDDERVYREAMRLVWEAAGVQVYVAKSATEGETLFRLLVPDLVILDVLMPWMNGLELIGKLRGLVGWEHVPIIVASALGLRANREAEMDTGANANLSKPFSSRKLRMMVRRFLPLAKTGELVPAAEQLAGDCRFLVSRERSLAPCFCHAPGLCNGAMSSASEPVRRPKATRKGNPIYHWVMQRFISGGPMERKPTALVIDDDRAYSQAMCDVLETAGVKMYVAVDAADAELLLQFLVPDLLIVDVKMPGMNGLDLVRRLRTTAGWEKVPIVMASGLWLREDRDAALAAGANAHLAKPFNSEELLEMARRFLPLAQTRSFSRLLRHEDLTR